MALFEWSEDYSVGIPSIDAQHQQLVVLINELHDGMLSGITTERVEAVLHGLVEYTAYHFGYEERLFAEHDYPAAEGHADAHDRLIDQVLDFKRRYDAGEASLNMELMVFLKDWLIGHVLGSDMAYGSHLAAAGVR